MRDILKHRATNSDTLRLGDGDLKSVIYERIGSLECCLEKWGIKGGILGGVSTLSKISSVPESVRNG